MVVTVKLRHHANRLLKILISTKYVCYLPYFSTSSKNLPKNVGTVLCLLATALNSLTLSSGDSSESRVFFAFAIK